MTMWFDSRKLRIKFLYASGPLVLIVEKMSFIVSGLFRFLLHVAILQSSWLKIPVWIKYGQRTTMSIKQGTISMRSSMRLRWICSIISRLMRYVWNFTFILFYIYIFYFIYKKKIIFYIFTIYRQNKISISLFNLYMYINLNIYIYIFFLLLKYRYFVFIFVYLLLYLHMWASIIYHVSVY